MGYVDLRRRREEQTRYPRERASFWDDASNGRYLSLMAAVTMLVAGFGIGIPSLLAALSPPGLVEFLIVAPPLIPAAALVWGGSKLWLARSRAIPRRAPEKLGAEKQLLLALRESGGLTAVEVALETSLTVDEAERILSHLAERGHLRVEGRDGALCYALPGRRSTGVTGPLRDPEGQTF